MVRCYSEADSAHIHAQLNCVELDRHRPCDSYTVMYTVTPIHVGEIPWLWDSTSNSVAVRVPAWFTRMVQALWSPCSPGPSMSMAPGSPLPSVAQPSASTAQYCDPAVTVKAPCGSRPHVCPPNQYPDELERGLSICVRIAYSAVLPPSPCMRGVSPHHVPHGVRSESWGGVLRLRDRDVSIASVKVTRIIHVLYSSPRVGNGARGGEVGGQGRGQQHRRCTYLGHRSGS